MRLKIEIEFDDQDCDEQLTLVAWEIKQLLEQLREMNEKGQMENSSDSDPELH
jgi:hypothetical protein